MVDSDSTESDSNGSHSCWKWKLRCFTLFPSTPPVQTFRHLNCAPERNTSAESLGTPTALESHSSNEARIVSRLEEELRKETLRSSTTNIANINSSSCDPPNSISLNSEQNQTRNNHSNSTGLLHLLGLHFNKSETRHLDRSIGSSSAQGEFHHKVSCANKKEDRYTKLPLSGSAKVKNPPHSTSLFHIQGKRPTEKNSKHLKGKSKSDNNLHRISLHHLTRSSLSTSTTRVSNDYTEQRLNSVQLGDHATISLPWKQNNLSTLTQPKSHPNTHTNIELNFRYESSESDSSAESETSFRLSSEKRQRSKSLERASSSRVSTDNFCSQIVSASKPQDRFAERANSIECHPHRRVRKTLNKREQEILLRYISSKSQVAPIRFSPVAKLTAGDRTSVKTRNNFSIGSDSRLQASLKESRIFDPPERISTSAQHSPRSTTVSSPGAISFPPSPPPRPPSTLKALKSRLTSPSDKAKLPTPSPTPTPTKTPLSAFPFPPVTMSSRAESPRAIHTPSANQFQSSGRQVLSDGPASSVHGTNGISAAAMASVEEARTSGFINKPTKGWLHSDKLLTKEGVTYAVRYIGCHDVNTSMKSLDFDTRSLIAKECINQVCEAAGFKSVDKKRKIDRRLVKILGMKPRLDHAGSDVCLTITSTCLRLTSLENGEVIAVHEMPNISFASGGDVTMLDFVAYVAKDATVGRACFVLECGSGLAQDVITTIGQAFELRFKEYLQKRPAPLPKLGNDDPEYYNDLPGKLPPEPQISQGESKLDGKPPPKVHRNKTTPTLTLDTTSEKDMAINLIDFEAPTPPAFGPVPPEMALESLLLDAAAPSVPKEDEEGGAWAQDPFDMQPLSEPLTSRSITVDEQQKELEAEPWFHGVISRGEAETLVVNDGDFLVRESQTTPHQYVLTGLQNGATKHLLLIDPKGVVRTKDRTFESVSHLIRHHRDSSRPIISAESIILLRTPVLRSSS